MFCIYLVKFDLVIFREEKNVRSLQMYEWMDDGYNDKKVYFYIWFMLFKIINYRFNIIIKNSIRKEIFVQGE